MTTAGTTTRVAKRVRGEGQGRPVPGDSIAAGTGVIVGSTAIQVSAAL
jgi:hypothetical protein